nr:MAG TPA_asm: hypothetical protein [Caudoviricetes sp.]
MSTTVDDSGIYLSSSSPTHSLRLAPISHNQSTQTKRKE